MSYITGLQMQNQTYHEKFFPTSVEVESRSPDVQYIYAITILRWFVMK